MNSNAADHRAIWVVDDSPTDAERVRRLFSAEYHVVIFHDGAAALERLSSGAVPDLLLLDWIMPGISGIEVCRYLRSAEGALSEIPVILLTNRSGPQEVVQAFSSGANDYVSKPFVDEELKARAEALLRAKRLYQRAEKAEADVRSLLTSAPDPIFAIDSEGKITFVNEEGLRVLNREQEQILGQPFADLVPGVGLRHIGVGPVESFLPGPDIHIAERVYSPSVRVLPSDNAASTTVALRDVTDRRRLESRRLDFYSVIAHDLRTPITSILLRLEMAFRGKHGVLPASHMGDLRKTETSLRSLMGMINDFLELARLEGVGYKIERNPVDLNKLVTSTVEDFVPLLEKNGLRWKHSGLEENVTVLADRQRLAQVMANLVGNAIKFTPGPGEVTTTLRATSFDVEFSVSDTGPGIPSEEIDGLFERYARSSNVARGAMGTGLGLMIVREIVEAHGGTVGAESLLGKGSRFWFRLPRTETESKA